MFKKNDIANLKNIFWAIGKIENSVNEISKDKIELEKILDSLD